MTTLTTVEFRSTIKVDGEDKEVFLVNANMKIPGFDEFLVTPETPSFLPNLGVFYVFPDEETRIKAVGM